jgi:THO complex subunit 2
MGCSYRQRKFNLLREESEGYAKLITEIGSSMLPFGTEMEEIHARVKDTLNNIASLVGYFNLEPNRVLDILLDIFAYNIVYYLDYYTALFEASPWCPVAGSEGDKSRRDIAGLLGFKLRFYQSIQKDNSDRAIPPPNELNLLVAVFIGKGHVRLNDILPHVGLLVVI